ncbi:MAG: YkgJ family cysteine cluster protein [Myxococcota bacterium]
MENPYWDLEEPQPHPDPSLGCIRRGLCCRSSPGWFAPGGVERAAELRDMTPDDFVRTYLVVDWIEVDGERVHVFAPAKVGRDGEPLVEPATRVDVLYQAFRGTCIFYGDGGCGIYEARPLECRRYDCTNAPEDNPTHASIARMWRDAAGEGGE